VTGGFADPRISSSAALALLGIAMLGSPPDYLRVAMVPRGGIEPPHRDFQFSSRALREWLAPAVGLYITAAYWFTSSTSFANPAITVARSLTNTFAGIAPHDVPFFIVAQLLGAAFAALIARWLFDPS
jgi:glycerol uptake facilitator-like aquaporin